LKTKKLPLLNDPIYGFIGIGSSLVFDLLSHPYFQRLRRISQMGLSSLVYPGARHSRFEHALGAMHLMDKTVTTLRAKGVSISQEEHQGLSCAMLLHDIGHGPFSHAIENGIFQGVSHEEISLGIMHQLNKEMHGALDLAIAIFTHQYPRAFMCQLVAGQLDLDRLDYLKRDAFYTGAAEGNINVHRLIAMLNVADDTLVVEEKGVFSVEKFLMARRFMYWQVYLHKTSLGAELMLNRLMVYVRQLLLKGVAVEMPSALSFFLSRENLSPQDPEALEQFVRLDDSDIFAALKQWTHHDDFLLADVAQRLLNRNLLKVIFQPTAFSNRQMDEEKNHLREMGYSSTAAELFVFSDRVITIPYNTKKSPINILKKNGAIVPFDQFSGIFKKGHWTEEETKFYLTSLKGKSS